MMFTDQRVVVLAGPGFEELEFWYAVLRSREAGADVTVAGIDGREVVSGRCSYPVAPDCALSEYDGQPALVFVPGLDGYEPEQLGAKTADILRRWASAGATIAATSNGVAALAAAGLLEGVTVSCPDSLAEVVERAGATLSAEPCTVVGRIATARSVEHVTDLFRALALGTAGAAR